VFGFAQAFEAGAAPITAFLIAPIAEFAIIPYMESTAGRETWGWLLGDGEARGIALVFLVAGLIMVVAGAAAFLTKSYRTLSATFAGETESVKPAEIDGGDLDAESVTTR
jgi:DHA3 family multidrug efflux protein-like MFS transporter